MRLSQGWAGDEEQPAEGLEIGRTYSTAIWSAGYNVVVEVEVLVEDGCVELCLAIEAVAHLLPAVGRMY